MLLSEWSGRRGEVYDFWGLGCSQRLPLSVCHRRHHHSHHHHQSTAVVICSLQGFHYVSIKRAHLRLVGAMFIVAMELTSELCACCVCVQPDESAFDYQQALLRLDDLSSKRKACGVCLLDVDFAMCTGEGGRNVRKLSHGGHQYHAPCANFWVNCVDSTLPALTFSAMI